MAGDGSTDGDSRVICKFCNKPAVNKIVKCVVCESSFHRYCCDKKRIEITINNTINCCVLTQNQEGQFGGSSSDGIFALTQDTNTEEPTHQPRNVLEMELEIVFLKRLLEEKEKIISDKCVIIADKHCIIQLQQREIDMLKSVVKGRGNNRVVFPPKVTTVGIENFDVDDIDGVNKRTVSDGEVDVNAPGSSYDRPGVSSVTATPEVSVSYAAVVENNNKPNNISRVNNQKWAQPETRMAVTRKRRKRDGVVGTGQSRVDVKTVPKKSLIYVSRFAPETTAESVRGIVSGLCPEVECERVQSKYPQYYSSFKIAVNDSNKELIMDPEVWPSGIYINKFFRSRGQGGAD